METSSEPTPKGKPICISEHYSCWLLTSLFIRLVVANDIEPGKELYTATHMTKTVTIDGKLDEWAGVPVLADPKFAVPKFSGTNANPNYVLFEVYAGGVWNGPDDQTSAVQVAWDIDNVYFGFVVTDDYHENMSGNAWDGDAIQLMIADATRTQQVALYDYALLGYENTPAVQGTGTITNTGTFVPDTANAATLGLDPTNPVYIMYESPANGDTTLTNEVVIKRDSINHKTTYEMRLPAASLGLTAPLTAGMQFGLGMAINDGDGYVDPNTTTVYGEGATQQGQKGWGGLGAHSIVFGKTPSETALVTLGTNVSGSDLIFLSAETPSVTGFSFRANNKGASLVNPASAQLTIDSKVVTLTAKPTAAGDAIDFTYVASPPFALDTDHTYSIVVKDTLGNQVTDQGKFRIASFKVGLNFGTDQSATTTALVATDVAGVPAVAQANWNNLSGNVSPVDASGNPTPTSLQSDQGANAFTTILATWTSDSTWSSTGAGGENNGFPAGPDQVLMSGYLNTGDATVTTVTLTNLPPEFTTLGYDVYVYTLGDTPGDGGGYRIVDPTGAVLKDWVLFTNPTNPSTYTEVPQTGGRGTGDYIVFSGLKAPAIVVQASTQSPQGAGSEHRAPINAIQLVPSAQPTAGPTLSVAVSAKNLVIQWTPTGGTLQTTPSLSGTPTWSDVGAANPATVTISTGNAFYRVRQ